MKKLILPILAVMLFTTAINFVNISAATLELKVGETELKVGGQSIPIDPGKGTKPVKKEGVVWLPLRAIIEQSGGNIVWNDFLKEATVTVGNETYNIKPNVNKVDSRVDFAPLPFAPYIDNQYDRIMITKEMFSDVLKNDVREDGDKVIIVSGKQEEQAIPEQIVTATQTPIAEVTPTPIVTTPAPTSVTPVPAVVTPASTAVPSVNVDPKKIPVDENYIKSNFKFEKVPNSKEEGLIITLKGLDGTEKSFSCTNPAYTNNNDDIKDGDITFFILINNKGYSDIYLETMTESQLKALSFLEDEDNN